MAREKSASADFGLAGIAASIQGEEARAGTPPIWLRSNWQASKSPPGATFTRWVIYLVLRRFGLLALVVGFVVHNTLVTFPVTTHLTRWYAAGAIAGLVTIVAVALLAMYHTLAGQPLFSTKALDD